MEASNGHTDEQTNGLDQTSEENSSQHDVTSLPAFQSVQEMGYQAEIIQQAFDVLKRSKGQQTLVRFFQTYTCISIHRSIVACIIWKKSLQYNSLAVIGNKMGQKGNKLN